MVACKIFCTVHAEDTVLIKQLCASPYSKPLLASFGLQTSQGSEELAYLLHLYLCHLSGGLGLGGHGVQMR
jgi:hypothetical protein